MTIASYLFPLTSLLVVCVAISSASGFLAPGSPPFSPVVRADVSSASGFLPQRFPPFSPAVVSLRMTPRPQVVPRSPSETMVALFNEQVTRELEASQLYLSASIWCDANDLIGMANFFKSESHDERQHALAMIEFANKRSIPVALSSLRTPDASWETPEDLWADVLTSEMENTQALLKLGDEAASCRDHSLTAFLMPYHMEQVNAEDNLRTILAKVRDENKTPGLLRQLDSELGSQAKAHVTG